MSFRVAGPAGPKQVESSMDLRTWTAVAAVSGTEAMVTDKPPEGARGRFYRARWMGDLGADFAAGVLEARSASVRLGWRLPQGAKGVWVWMAPTPELVATPNPTRRLLTTLGAEATEYRAGNLAAGVDAFFRIEVDTLGGVKTAQVHARTAGGPRARLETRLREAQGFAPHILQVTLADGPTATLKEGWSVCREDGTEIPLRAVHRNSVPVSAPDYPMGLEPGGSLRVEVDHQIFLELGETIGESALLEVQGPKDFGSRFPSATAISRRQ